MRRLAPAEPDAPRTDKRHLLPAQIDLSLIVGTEEGAVGALVDEHELTTVVLVSGVNPRDQACVDHEIAIGAPPDQQRG